MEFHNSGNVENQIGSQTIRGNVYNAFYSGQGPSSVVGQEDDSDVTDDRIRQSLAFPEMFHRRNTIEQHHPLTCKWIFTHEQYLLWKEDTRGLLWIKGLAGSGKSTMMTVLHENIEQHRKGDNGLVYLNFYFSARGSELQKTRLGMLRSLLCQLFTQDEVTRMIVRTHWNEQCIAFGSVQNEWNWESAQLERLLTHAVLETAKQRCVLILVDALDEAGNDTAQELATYLHRLAGNASDNSSMVKICISCRHYPVTNTRGSREICVDKYNNDDIRQFVCDALCLEPNSGESAYETSQWHELKQEIIESAKGNFQWTKLALRIVQNAFDDGRPLEDVRRRLHQVPHELTHVYEHILTTVISPHARAESFELFQWVCLATRPLSLGEMRHALATAKVRSRSAELRIDDGEGFIATDVQTEKQVLSLSGGLLEMVTGPRLPAFGIATNTKYVQVTHHTVTEYLLDRGLGLLDGLKNAYCAKMSVGETHAAGAVLIDQGHSQLYWTCLKYLASQDPIFTMDALLMMYHTRGNYCIDITGIDRLRRMHYDTPFIFYAASSMCEHAKLARTRRSQELAHEVSLMEAALPAFRIVGCLILRRKWPEFDTTVLHIAARLGLVDMYDRLVRNNADVQYEDRNGYSAIHHATWGGHLSIVQRLHSSGVSLNKQTKTNKSLLCIAVAQGDVALVRWLLQHGASADEYDETDGRPNPSPLCIAVTNGNKTLVSMVLDAGATVDLSTAEALFLSDRGSRLGQYTRKHLLQSCNALHIACCRGHAKIVLMLLNAGANVNLMKACTTPLQEAVQNGDVETVSILLDAGAETNLHDVRRTVPPLHLASARGDLRLTKVLLHAGAEINLVVRHKGTPLSMAASAGHKEVVSLLLRAGAQVAPGDGIDGNALLAATNEGHQQIMDQLIQAQSDILRPENESDNSMR